MLDDGRASEVSFPDTDSVSICPATMSGWDGPAGGCCEASVDSAFVFAASCWVCEAVSSAVFISVCCESSFEGSCCVGGRSAGAMGFCATFGEGWSSLVPGGGEGERSVADISSNRHAGHTNKRRFLSQARVLRLVC